MKANKGFHATRRDVRENYLTRNYQLYAGNLARNYRNVVSTREAGMQYNYKKDNVLCTCGGTSRLKRHEEVRYFRGFPRQSTAYHRSRSFTDVGVGCVKESQRKKVKRVYLPETDNRGVGSSDLSSCFSRRTRCYRDYSCVQKKMSAKCVGGLVEGIVDLLNEKLSPIIRTRTGITSPKAVMYEVYKKSVDSGNNTCQKKFLSTSTQVHDIAKRQNEDNKDVNVIEVTVIKNNQTTETQTPIEEKPVSERAQEAERVFSSDSFVQHVHNLELPSEEKSAMLIDPMENQLEREYRKMFSVESKDSKEQKQSVEEKVSDMKSTSVLRKRFEALRRGLTKKEDSKRHTVVIKDSIKEAPSRKDVSITSDPPSLEGRSYSNAKLYSPLQNKDQFQKTSNEQSPIGKEEPNSHIEGDGKYPDVKGMFKLWGNEFNLDAKDCPPGPSAKVMNNSKENKIPNTKGDRKKDGRKFFFFKKKSKDKNKQPYKPKGGVTAGRCEVGDGLMIKIGTVNSPPPEEKCVQKYQKAAEEISEEYVEMFRKGWLQKFLERTIESRNSVKVRWNNKAYSTSSSTIYEMLENVYKNTGVVFRSQSEITTRESSVHKAFATQRVKFRQDVEAWMMPSLIPDKITLQPVKIITDKKEDKENDNIKVTISDRKWSIEKCKAYAHRIEVVLHSKNVNQPLKDPSSEYLRIDIPKGFFSDTSAESTERNQTSNEEVYKIVEYDTPDSNSAVKNTKNLGLRHNLTEDIKVTVSIKENGAADPTILQTVIKGTSVQREIGTPESNEYMPKRCNVIGVGIITQKDVAKLRKPILKIRDDYTDEDSDKAIQSYSNKSKLVDSYIEDYYRDWVPMGIDLISWRVNDSPLKSSETSHTHIKSQGDGSISCPNIYDEYQRPDAMSSCGTPSCSSCASIDKPKQEPKMSKLLSKLKSFATKDGKAKAEFEDTLKRVHPKDSLAVYKRRKIVNACSNKSKWSSYNVDDNLHSESCVDITDLEKGTCEKKISKKHVTLPDCDRVIPGILSFKGSSKCDMCKDLKIKCSKQVTTNPNPTCQIPPPNMPCKETEGSSQSLKQVDSSQRTQASATPPKCCSRDSLNPGLLATLSPTKSPQASKNIKESKPGSPQSSSKQSTLPCQKQSRPGSTKMPGSEHCSSKEPCCGQKSSSPLASSKSPPEKQSPLRQKTSNKTPPPLCKKSSLQLTNKAQISEKTPCGKPKCRSKSSSCKKAQRNGKKICISPSPTRVASPKHDSGPPKGLLSKLPSLFCRSHGSMSCSCNSNNSIALKSPLTSSRPQSPRQQPSPNRLPREQPSPNRSPRQQPSPNRSPRQQPSPIISLRKEPSPNRSPRQPSPNRSPRQQPSPNRSPRQPSPNRSPQQQPCPFRSPQQQPSPNRSRQQPSPNRSTCQQPCPNRSPGQPSPNRSPRQQPSPNRSRQEPSPNRSTCQQPSPNRSRQQPSPNRSPRQPSPNRSPRQEPSPTRSRQQPSPNRSRQEPSPKRSRQQPSPKRSRAQPSPNRSPQQQPCPFRSPQQQPSPNRSPLPAKPSPQKSPNPASTLPSPKLASKTSLSCPERPCSPKMCKKCSSNEFPWPTKNQVSNSPSATSVHLEPCEKKSLLPNMATSNPQPNIAGIHLKMEPSKKCPEECAPCNTDNRSEDNIVINIKPGTPSTEEIRNGMHIKVQDADGRTLYERVDYVKNNPSISKDAYKTNKGACPKSIVQNVALPDQSSPNLEETKSDNSVGNLVVINFRLKITPDTETHDISIGNEEVEDEPEIVKTDKIGQTSHTVFFLKDESEQCNEEVNDKNDINIQITLKNLKPKKKNDDRRYSVDVGNFTRIISDKFRTISTGYCDVPTDENNDFEKSLESELKNDKDINLNDDKNVYSILRTTIDFASSNDILKIKMTSDEAASSEIVKEELVNIEKVKSDIENLLSKNDSEVEELQIYFEDESFDKLEKDDSLTDTNDQESSDVNNTTNDCSSSGVMSYKLTRADKKLLFKKVFEKACNNNENKDRSKIRQVVKDMLKIILSSDSSEHDNGAAVTSNELYKEMTYASMMNLKNYYNNSVMSSMKDLKQDMTHTEHESLCSTVSSDVLTSDKDSKEKKGCMCNMFAARLNLRKTGEQKGMCCCQKPAEKANVETCCDLTTDEKFILLDYQTIEYINVDENNSKSICNSTNLSMQSKSISSSTRQGNSGESKMVSEIVDDSNRVYKKITAKRTWSQAKDDPYILNKTCTNVSTNQQIYKETQKVKRDKTKSRKISKFDNPADILQSYETKKAVLEIYAEKTVSDEEERLVAKLPKFVYDKESEIERNYEQFGEHSNKALKRNIVMSVNR